MFAQFALIYAKFPRILIDVLIFSAIIAWRYGPRPKRFVLSAENISTKLLDANIIIINSYYYLIS